MIPFPRAENKQTEEPNTRRHIAGGRIRRSPKRKTRSRMKPHPWRSFSAEPVLTASASAGTMATISRPATATVFLRPLQKPVNEPRKAPLVSHRPEKRLPNPNRPRERRDHIPRTEPDWTGGVWSLLLPRRSPPPLCSLSCEGGGERE